MVRQLSEELSIEYKTLGPPGKEKITVREEPSYFNPEAIRAARVFMQDVSNYQINGKGNIQFIYHPSKLVNKNQRDIHPNKEAGGWVHLASLVEFMKGVVIRNYNDVPFHDWYHGTACTQSWRMLLLPQVMLCHRWE